MNDWSVEKRKAFGDKMRALREKKAAESPREVIPEGAGYKYKRVHKNAKHGAIQMSVTFHAKDAEIIGLLEKESTKLQMNSSQFIIHALRCYLDKPSEDGLGVKPEKPMTLGDASENDVDAWLAARTVAPEPKKKIVASPFGNFGDVDALPRSITDDDGIPSIPMAVTHGNVTDVPVGMPAGYHKETV